MHTRTLSVAKRFFYCANRTYQTKSDFRIEINKANVLGRYSMLLDIVGLHALAASQTSLCTSICSRKDLFGYNHVRSMILSITKVLSG